MPLRRTLNMQSFQKFAVILGFALGALAAPAFAAPATSATPAPTLVHESVTGVATVESVDLKTREVLLSDPSGKLMTVVAGPGIYNLPQVKSGDKVVLTYQRAVGVQLAAAGKTLPPAQGETGVLRAAQGQLPAGAAYELVQATVSFVSYDTASKAVTFTDADGTSHTVTLRTAAMQNFAGKLKAGDNVQVDYLQAISISVVRPGT